MIAVATKVADPYAQENIEKHNIDPPQKEGERRDTVVEHVQKEIQEESKKVTADDLMDGFGSFKKEPVALNAAAAAQVESLDETVRDAEPSTSDNILGGMPIMNADNGDVSKRKSTKKKKKIIRKKKKSVNGEEIDGD